MTFGRAVDCSVVLNDELVSRHHAAIEPTPTGYRLVDTGSRNGVYVGDQRVAELALTHQARFRIGSTTFEFVAPTPRGEPAAPRTFIVRVVSPGVPADAGRSIEADSGIATVGRGDDCTLTLADLATSRHHARIEALEDGRFRLVDTRSANGLWVEGRRVAEETVLPGQRFRIGSTVLECEFLGDATADVERTVMLPAAKPAPAAAAALEATAPPPAPKPPALETAGDALDSVVKPFLLDDPASVYYVASGKVEIFTITVQGQRPVGARTSGLACGTAAASASWHRGRRGRSCGASRAPHSARWGNTRWEPRKWRAWWTTGSRRSRRTLPTTFPPRRPSRDGLTADRPPHCHPALRPAS
jgi:pSer/pThr/pTyr-binding forkhead associated (FHA) protein